VLQTRRGINEARDLALRSFGTGSTPGMDLELMVAADRYRMHLCQRAERLQHALVGQTERLERVRRDYLEASKQRKVLDRLKERQQAASVREQRGEEFSAADDSSTARFGRGAGAGPSPSEGVQ
jgi:flagellar export protein FliJ